MFLFFIILVFFGAYGCCVRDYVVPVPTIELIYPKGFSVKIPHSEGITLFAFHGKINEEMRDLEAGRFSKDILRKRGDFWIFQDGRTRLNVGDKIYYWLFVIKDGLGFRYDDGEYTITENTGYRIDDPIDATTHRPRSTSTKKSKTTLATDPESTTSITHQAKSTTNMKPAGYPSDGIGTTEHTTLEKTCENTILNITKSLLALQTELNSLKDTNEILKEISEKHPDSARTLKVEGRIPVNEDALSTVKGIIKQKLALSIEIVEAERNKDGSITFRTESLDDKVEVIKASKEKLRYSKIYLVY